MTTKKAPLKPARTRTAAKPAAKLTREEALQIGRTTREERKAWRRRLQKRRIAQRQRDKKKAAILAKRVEGSVWTLPPDPSPASEAPADADYSSLLPADPEESIQKGKPPRKPASYVRRAVRAEPTSGTRGPNRGGESARSWQPAGERNPTGPVGPGFLDEEY